MPRTGNLLLLAEAPEALVELCGVSLLERLLRTAQRLGFARAFVSSSTPEAIRGELARPSWARADIATTVFARPAGAVTPAMLQPLAQDSDAPILLVPAHCYCDSRLLAALANAPEPCALVDAAVPERARLFFTGAIAGTRGQLCGPVRLSQAALAGMAQDQPLFGQVRQLVETGAWAGLDAAALPDYIVSMRRRLRPLCFPAAAPEHHAAAERVILDTAQKGTLDLPAYVHSPIETAIIARLCRLPVSPNQVTIFGFALGLCALLAFATGHVVIAVVLALLFGLADGLDGKQARVKIEMTAGGEWEHKLDWFIEHSWWAAIAWQLWRSGQMPAAPWFFALLMFSHLSDELVRRKAKLTIGKLLDDVSPFDRLFRLIGARRNIYTWILALGLLLGRFVQAYRLVCLWAFVTLLVHAVRSFTVVRGARVRAGAVRPQRV